MAYSELVKNFEKIRDYMREFFVYGFKSRNDYDKKSARSYDNERRRIESWMGDFMAFRQDAAGKNVFISVDSRSVLRNPLYQAFKAKSFTDNDITLHFYILDLLADGQTLTVKEVIDGISEKYLSQFSKANELDESTVRKKLKEYEKLGLLVSSKRGRELAFTRSSDALDLESWGDAAAFFSEIAPAGVIGSTIDDKINYSADCFGYKHHYCLHALDSQILYRLLIAIRQNLRAELSVITRQSNGPRIHKVYPIRIYASTQNGRQHLLCYHFKFRRMMFFRLDSIHSITLGDREKEPDRYEAYYQKFKENLWGVSTGIDLSLEHLEMTVYVGDREGFIIDRLSRECRCGSVEYIDAHHIRFIADVYDAAEMVPWIRTFIGRITQLDCTNAIVQKRVWEDYECIKQYYGGDPNALS